MADQLPETATAPRSVTIAERGVRTSSDFANLMSAMMTDLALGRLTPQVGNAMCNAGGKLLKVVEMQQKYGTHGDGQTKDLLLSNNPL